MSAYSEDTIKRNAVFIYHTLCSVGRCSSKCTIFFTIVNNDEQMPVQSSFISTIHLFANSKNKKIVEPSLKRNSYIHKMKRCELLLSFYGRIWICQKYTLISLEFLPGRSSNSGRKKEKTAHTRRSCFNENHGWVPESLLSHITSSSSATIYQTH